MYFCTSGGRCQIDSPSETVTGARTAIRLAETAGMPGKGSTALPVALLRSSFASGQFAIRTCQPQGSSVISLLAFAGHQVLDVLSALGCRLMAGQRILVPSVRVRLLPPQPLEMRCEWPVRLAV